MILGLDIHGVIDKDPVRFAKLAKEIQKDGGKVYIITGVSTSNPLLKEILDRCNFSYYDKIFSVEDYLIEHETKVEYIKENNDKMFDLDQWNSCKAKICKENKVDLHIDDCKKYGEYFETSFAYFNGEDFEIFQL